VKSGVVNVLQRVVLHQIFVDQRRVGVMNALLHDERRFDRARLEQVRVVAHLPELHEDVHDAEEVRGIVEGLSSLVRVDVLIVEKPLASRELTLDNVLHLLRELLLNVTLHASQQEGPQDTLKLLDYRLGA
jgi:hypothetical protein